MNDCTKHIGLSIYKKKVDPLAYPKVDKSEQTYIATFRQNFSQSSNNFVLTELCSLFVAQAIEVKWVVNVASKKKLRGQDVDTTSASSASSTPSILIIHSYIVDSCRRNNQDDSTVNILSCLYC